jgi:hypothetical protein
VSKSISSSKALDIDRATSTLVVTSLFLIVLELLYLISLGYPKTNFWAYLAVMFGEVDRLLHQSFPRL